MTQPSYVSRNGLERLKSELEQLPTVRRQDIADRIQQSREKGGVESNAEYEDSKNELAFIEGRILTLDNMINSAVIIKEGSGSGDTVEVGNTIAVKDQGTKSTHRPFAVRGWYSPCEGDGLMGAAEFGGAWLTQGRLSRLECCSSGH